MRLLLFQNHPNEHPCGMVSITCTRCKVRNSTIAARHLLLTELFIHKQQLKRLQVFSAITPLTQLSEPLGQGPSDSSLLSAFSLHPSAWHPGCCTSHSLVPNTFPQLYKITKVNNSELQISASEVALDRLDVIVLRSLCIWALVAFHPNICECKSRFWHPLFQKC